MSGFKSSLAETPQITAMTDQSAEWSQTINPDDAESQEWVPSQEWVESWKDVNLFVNKSTSLKTA